MKDNFKKFLGSFLGYKNFNNLSTFEELGIIETRLAYKKLAFETCVSLIANAIAQSEFETYENGEKVRKTNYYMLNVQPNCNQNAHEFWRDVVTKLLHENEVLIVDLKNGYFMADSFNHEEKVFYEDVYKDITVRGYQLNDTFRESEVIYLKYNDKDIKKLVDSMYDDYSTLIEAASKGYKQMFGRKVILDLDSLATFNDAEKEARETLFNEHFKNFFNNVNAVLPLGKGMAYHEVKSTSNINDSRDIKNMIDDIYQMTCSAFHVPVSLAQGSVSGLTDLIDSFIMFGVKPIANIGQKELNRKVYDQTDFINRTYVKVNTQKLKLTDLKTMAVTADLLARVGVHNADENRDMIGLEPKGLTWAQQYYMTKNYSNVLDTTVNDTKGKNKNEE